MVGCRGGSRYFEGEIPSCFLIDIDLIFKILRIFLDGSAGFFGARLFENRQNLNNGSKT